mgnify:CR=1 FL=1
MDLGIKGKVALVMASSRGLGQAMAVSLAREGVKVAVNTGVHDRSTNELVTTDPAKLVGNYQTINIEQTGASNVLALGVNSTVTSGVGVNLNYQVSDGNNTGYINICIRSS